MKAALASGVMKKKLKLKITSESTAIEFTAGSGPAVATEPIARLRATTSPPTTPKPPKRDAIARQDTIVVYKVDGLTRSVADFAKVVAI